MLFFAVETSSSTLIRGMRPWMMREYTDTYISRAGLMSYMEIRLVMRQDWLQITNFDRSCNTAHEPLRYTSAVASRN